MTMTLKCAECGHNVQAEGEDPQTCPMCEGTMTKPKYKAKSGPTSSDTEKAKAKPKAKPADDEDEEEKPKAKKAAPKPKEEALSLDDDEEVEANFARDGKIAKRIGIDPGFSDSELMKQVGAELSPDEELHWAGRPSLPVVKKHALMTMLGGIFFGLIGAAITAFVLSKKDIPWFVPLITSLFILVGIGIAIFGPILKIRQAKHGWYAVTNQRAIVCEVYPWGRKGHITTYNPSQLRNLRTTKSFWLKGAGSVVFKTEIHITTTTSTNRRGGRSTSTSRKIVHYGFLDVENVEDVGILVRDVIFGVKKRRNDDEDEDEDEE